MNKALRVPDYLEHILQALERIARYTAGVFKPVNALVAADRSSGATQA